ncbi:MAG: right-handed parallel beta-helix repeat-containing protein [Planctomycetota bacterium]
MRLLSTLCFVALLALLPEPAAARTVYFVNADAPAGGSGRDWNDAFDRLELALAVAQSGEQVWVAGGSYSPFASPVDRDATFDVPSGVEVYGGFFGNEQQLGERQDPFDRPSVLDGQGVSYNVVTIDDAAPGTTLDGFLITGGLADGVSGRRSRGAGIHAEGAAGSTPTLRNLRISGCAADLVGSAIFAGSLSPNPIVFDTIRVSGCSGNQSAVFVADGSTDFADVDITGNSVTGLVISAGGFHRIADSRIESNTSPSPEPTFLPSDAGGVFIDIEPAGIGSEIVDSIIQNNTGPRTGGIRYRGGGEHVIRSSRILNNTASSSATETGGIGVAPSGAAAMQVSIDNCLVANNHNDSPSGSSAVFVTGTNTTLNIRSSTIAGNSGDGLNTPAINYATGGASGAVVNTIIWGNTNAGPANSVSDSLNAQPPGPIADRCIIEFYPANPVNVPYPTTDCSGQDPLFSNTSSYDLSPGSPAIDAGDNNQVPPLVTTDLFNRPRFRDDAGTADTGEGFPGEPIIDLGAAEFQGTTPIDCLADTNGDGLVNPADFSAWVIAFNTQSPACDQNDDGLCNPADFTAWVINFNAGC